MSIADLKPRSVPAELRVKIERVMAARRLSWRAAIVYLARDLVGRGPPTSVT